MSPVRYSLHYEDYSEQLMSRFGKLLQQQALVDMTLMCSTHTLRVHKAVLAASSAYFEEVLQKVAGEPLVVLKISFSVLKSLVEFMYCGRTACGHDSLSELLAAARFLGIKGLSRVTREGLGITQHEEIPEFPAPVVINRPPPPSGSTHAPAHPHMHAQEGGEPQPSTSRAGGVASDYFLKTDAETCLPMHCVTRRPDAAVRAPLEAGGDAAAMGGAYGQHPRTVRPRRGRPSMRVAQRGRGGGGGGAGWERRGGAAARAGERVPLRQECDSRHAAHRLSSLHNSRMQEYMAQVSLTQAVESICGPERAEGYELAAAATEGAAPALSSAMSQYVNALKSAGLPTDLPIVFETGDGSYVNVDEQVLMDMVQSSEIQYEVVERPISLEAAARPGQVKSIDDLTRCIEQGAMRSFSQEEGGGLSAILPDSAEPYSLPEPPARADRAEPPDGDPFGPAALADVTKYCEEHYGVSPGAAAHRAGDCFELELARGAYRGDALDCLADADDRFGGMLKFHDRPEPEPEPELESQPEPEPGSDVEMVRLPELAAPPGEQAAHEPRAGAEVPGERGTAESDAGSEIEKLIDKIKAEKLTEGGAPPALSAAAGGAGGGRRPKRRASHPPPGTLPANDSRCLRSKVKKKL